MWSFLFAFIFDAGGKFVSKVVEFISVSSIISSVSEAVATPRVTRLRLCVCVCVCVCVYDERAVILGPVGDGMKRYGMISSWTCTMQQSRPSLSTRAILLFTEFDVLHVTSKLSAP